MSARGVMYQLANSKHAPVLIVSIWSLRKTGYTGPIHMAVADDKAQVIAQHVEADPRLHPFTWVRWAPPVGMRNSGYLAKTYMGGLSPFHDTLFLDADTMVVGDLDRLFDFSKQFITLTQFSNWRSNGRKVAGRIKSWADVAPRDVEYVSRNALPAINTGVISWRTSTASDRFFAEWKELTARKPVFICDELAAQLIFHRHDVRVLDSRYNCSPIHDKRQDAVIYHFHGKKHVNRDQGKALWLPAYEEVCGYNLAKIREWTPAGDRRLREYLEGRDGAGTPDEESDEESDTNMGR